MFDFHDLPEDRQNKYRKMVEKSKSLTKEGEIKLALVALEKAYSIFKSDKIARRIDKFREYLRDKGKTLLVFWCLDLARVFRCAVTSL